MKLFTRYNRINMSLMALLFLIIGIVYYVLLSQVLVHEVDEALGKYEKRVHQYVSENDSLPVFRNFEEVEVTYHRSDQFRERKISQAELYNHDDRKTEMFRIITFSQRVDGKWYEVVVAKPLEGTKLLTKTLVYSTLIILLAVLGASLLINRLILKKLWKPFYSSMDSMNKFKLGSPVLPILPLTDIEEFDMMNNILSRTTASAREDYRILKEFTENASHELQTPLAIIRSKLDLVIQDEELSEAQSESLKSAYAAVTRLAKLNQSLLLLAKIENHQYSGTEQISMKAKVEEKLLQFNEFWSDAEIKVITQLEEATISANPELVDILLNNMLSNAGRHVGDRGNILVSVQQGRLEIANTAKDGPLDQSRLFKRFYKESQYSRYNGLGLSIVKQICEQSGIQLLYHFEAQQHHFIFNWK